MLYTSSKWVVGGMYIIDYILFNFAVAIRTYFQKIADPQDIAPSSAVGFTINHIAAVFLPALGGYLWMLNYRIPFLMGAALGVVSCIVPSMLIGMIQVLLGLLNIIGGAVSLIKRFFPILHEIRTPSAAPATVTPIILKRLMATQTMLNFVTIAFGISMLMPGLVSGLVVAGILVINGLLLFILVSFLQEETGMQASGIQPSI